MRRDHDGFIRYIGKRPAINQFDEALIHYREDRFASALKCINQHIKDNKHDVRAYYMKTHLLECMEKWHEAILCIEKVWGSEVVYPDMMLLRALQYMHVGDMDRSLEFVDSAEKSGVPIGDVCLHRAMIMCEMYRRGRSELLGEAVKYILEACDKDALNEQSHSEAANILYTQFEKRGRADADSAKKSIMHGVKAIDLGDKQIRTYYNLGRAWMHLGNAESAIKYFKQVTKADKKSANAQAMIGIVIMMQKRKNDSNAGGRKEAKKYLDKALKMNPKLAFALQAKAILQLGEANFKGAQITLKALTNLEPHNTQAWVCLAVTYAEQHGKDPVENWPKMERAAQCLERAAKNAKYVIPEPSDLQIASGNSMRERRIDAYNKYTVLDLRYDDTIM